MSVLNVIKESNKKYISKDTDKSLLSDYIKNVKIVVKSLTKDTGINRENLDDFINKVSTLKNTIIKYSNLRTLFGKPDTDFTFVLFNLSNAYTPEGKIIRCIAEIEDRINAILSNLDAIDDLLEYSGNDKLENSELQSSFVYFKAAVDKLIFILNEIQTLVDKYNIDLNSLSHRINEISMKEKIYSIIDSVIINTLTNNMIQISNNLELLYKIGVDPRIVLNNINEELHNVNNVLDYGTKLKIIKNIYNKIEPYIRKYMEYHGIEI